MFLRLLTTAGGTVSLANTEFWEFFVVNNWSEGDPVLFSNDELVLTADLDSGAELWNADVIWWDSTLPAMELLKLSHCNWENNRIERRTTTQLLPHIIVDNWVPNFFGCGCFFNALYPCMIRLILIREIYHKIWTRPSHFLSQNLSQHEGRNTNKFDQQIKSLINKLIV